MNFALILFTLMVITGIAWVADRQLWLPRRRRAADAAVIEYERRQQRSEHRLTDKQIAQAHEQLRQSVLKQPWWLEYSAGFFPVILTVFVLRSFVAEPFKIPSGSMMPTLVTGDFILVNKFEYGIRLPVINQKILANRSPKRGDIIVFRYPKDESIDYIKRVVGRPGDTVAYLNKQLSINGKPVPTQALPDYFDEEHTAYLKQYEETIDNKKITVLNNPAAPPFVIGADDFSFRKNCEYSGNGIVCKVPPGHYFVMGDNRDNSLDSRYWGFVPDQNLIGRAFFIWLNFGNLKRIGGFD